MFVVVLVGAQKDFENIQHPKIEKSTLNMP